ncbi:phosphatidate cytidylyltransferase [Mangrovibacterium diazotrophicum]|uniref:Phosphatidate cytidylyltransferase n=1 Tax=Mangrovibacterium diazotrophicum TaxID=1261403 RepID=A0A419VYD0_9BACT|nr:phosphatidate cytidylyltransferase [Mangrovibacterium diazotrophicum]RKD88245.1 phosphatidate cytidylyltransferase [Mangrovibacterium diazotrophicum]
MIQTIYIIILVYFVLGGIGFYLINRKKDPAVARESYTKFIAYFFIINILFFSIVLNPVVFRYLALVIGLVGVVELFRLFNRRNLENKVFFGFSLLLYFVLTIGFFLFSGLSKELILFSFLVLSIFDAFSQISGQLFGKTRILPEISPNKTLGGVVGGALFAVASAFVLKRLYDGSWLESVLLAAGIVVFAFLGDIAASYYKRKYQVKDYSKLIPGHGGFLDRFDSLIAGGAWVAFCVYVLNF